MLDIDGKLIDAKVNQAVDFHPRWSHIAAWDSKLVDSPVCNAQPPSAPAAPTNSWRNDNTWVTLVNGTPKKMRIVDKQSDHVDYWDKWVDIAPGKLLFPFFAFPSSIHNKYPIDD